MGDKPEHIEKYENLDQKVTRLIDTTERTHRKARLAAEEHLLDDDGKIDYKKMQNGDVREKVKETKVDTYISAAKDEFHVSDEAPMDDKVFRDRLLQTYINTTENQLGKLMEQHKENYFNVFEDQVKPRLMSQLEQELRPIAYDHLKNEHRGDLVKHAKAEELVDANKLTLDQARELYKNVLDNKGITKGILKSLPEYALTDKAKREYEIIDEKYAKTG